MTDEWQLRHGVSDAAMAELWQLLAQPATFAAERGTKSENAIQANLRLAAPGYASLLWRNNVGVAFDDDGVPTRYGLANDSKKLNEKVKSSDLIGIASVRVQAHHVGRLFGVFTAAECKHEGWRWSGRARELAQNRFVNIVKGAGGIGFFATQPQHLLYAIQNYTGAE